MALLISDLLVSIGQTLNDIWYIHCYFHGVYLIIDVYCVLGTSGVAFACPVSFSSQIPKVDLFLFPISQMKKLSLND